MSTPIYDFLAAQEAEDRLEEAMGPNYHCPACYQEAKGWGGNGCCDICDMSPAEHTCDRGEP